MLKGRYSKSIFLSILCITAQTYYFELNPSYARQVRSGNNHQYDVSVTLKLVQVYVIDKQGKPVTDLKRSEFKLYDNGQPRTITEFEAHILSLGKILPSQRIPVPSEQVLRMNRKFFLFFDFAFNSEAGIITAKKAAIDFMEMQMRPGDEVGIVSYSARSGLTIHEYLTSNRQRIRQTIEGLGAEKLLGRAADIQSEWLKEHKKLDQALDTEMSNRIAEADGSVYKREAVSYASQVSEFARALGHIPGIKNVILFSSGVANYMLYGGTKYLDDTQSRWGDASLRERFSVMCKELTSSNVAVFAINSSGVGSARFEERDLMGDGSLRQMARESGGKYFDNVSRYEDINKDIQNITGTYYVLGYHINEKKDGSFHKIRVKVIRRGCEVFGQGGYFSPKPFPEYSENEKLLHIIDLALAENRYLDVPAEIPMLATPIMVHGKMHVVTYIGLPTKLAANIVGNTGEVVSLLFDERGDIASIGWLKITNPSLDKNLIMPELIIPARSGRAVCRIALCNMETGFGARGSATLIVPDAREAVIWVDPPLFLAKVSGEEIGVSPEATLAGLYAYDPREYTPLIGDLPAGLKSYRLAVRLTSIRSNAEFALTAGLNEIGSPTSRAIPIIVLHKSQDGPTMQFLVDLESGELRPATYTLSLTARDKSGSVLGSTTSRITVK